LIHDFLAANASKRAPNFNRLHAIVSNHPSRHVSVEPGATGSEKKRAFNKEPTLSEVASLPLAKNLARKAAA
jgi:hypothetical protein